MQSIHRRKNVTIGGHRTSLCLEHEIWDALDEICQREQVTIHQLCTLVDERRLGTASRTSAVRAFAVSYFRNAATDFGHALAGHGEGQRTTKGRRRIPPSMAIEIRRRLLSAPYFERRQQIDRRQLSAMANAAAIADQERRLQTDRRQSFLN
jgi:predicted DNA-binding ribbon-helix-helix protein